MVGLELTSDVLNTPLTGVVGNHPDYARMQQENLLSFVIVASLDPVRDAAAVTGVADFVKDRFAYVELVLVAAAPPRAWTEAMQALGVGVANLRIITIQNPMGYEELASAALGHAIGDYIVSLFPGEIGLDDLEQVLMRLAEGRDDLIKTRYAKSSGSWLEAGVMRLTQAFIKISTGHRIEAYQGRALAMSRTAASRIQTVGGTLKFFRIIDVSDQISVAHVDITAPPPRRLWSAFYDKLRQVADLVSLSAARLIRSLALICAILAIVSFAVTAMSFTFWLFMANIAPGWTSLSMLFSFLFGANFSVLAAICLGLLQLIRHATPKAGELFYSEMAGGDFFTRDDRLNVEAEEAKS